MPLLHRRPFVPAVPPADLHSEEQASELRVCGERARGQNI